MSKRDVHKLETTLCLVLPWQMGNWQKWLSSWARSMSTARRWVTLYRAEQRRYTVSQSCSPTKTSESPCIYGISGYFLHLQKCAAASRPPSSVLLVKFCFRGQKGDWTMQAAKRASDHIRHGNLRKWRKLVRLRKRELLQVWGT